MLAVSWGTEIYLLEFQQIEDEKSGIRTAGYFKSQEEIGHLEFISENLLLMYDYKKDLKILYTGFFIPQNSIEYAEPQDYAKVILNSQVIDPDISFQICAKESSERRRPIIFYSNTINAIDTIRRVFILGYKRAYVGKLYSWQEYLEELIEKAEWLSALSLCISLYQGKFSSEINKLSRY